MVREPLQRAEAEAELAEPVCILFFFNKHQRNKELYHSFTTNKKIILFFTVSSLVLDVLVWVLWCDHAWLYVAL